MIELAELAVMVPAVVPNLTPEADARLVPVMMTLVPPAIEPPLGLIAVTVGGVT